MPFCRYIKNGKVIENHLTKKPIMNFDNYTIKTQEALQHAQQIAQNYGHQQIENEHLDGIYNR